MRRGDSAEDRLPHLRYLHGRQRPVGLPRADGQLRGSRLVAAHGRSGQVPRPGALVHGLREHRRLVLRHHGAREPRPRHGKALLRRLPAGNRPRHGAGEPAVSGPPRHCARPRCDRQFDRRLPGARDGARTARFRPEADPDRHGGPRPAVDHRCGRSAAHGPRGRHHVRHRLSGRRAPGHGSRTRDRSADLPRLVGLQRDAAGT